MVNWVKRQRVYKSPQALHKHNVGKLGEDIAASYLRKKGFKILTRNFKARYGEIDVIALDHDTLVFVEVKTRIGNQFGTPEEAVTPWKIREIIKAGQYYALRNPQLPTSLRIDVIAILLDPESRKPLSVTHVPNITL